MNGTDHLVTLSTGGWQVLELYCPVWFSTDTTDKSLLPGLYKNAYKLIPTTFIVP